MATIYGRSVTYSSYRYSNFDDNLAGTSSADTIYGLGGNDTIWGGSGNDTIDGGSGNDYITANSREAPGAIANWGLDKVHGGSGDDTLDFANTTARVELYGDDGIDMIFGGSGNDYLNGGADWDYLSGGAGADYIDGGAGGDYMFGGANVDWLFGGSGNDEMSGGSGDDRLTGGLGADIMTGGSGIDTFVFTSNAESGLSWGTADTITDFDRDYDWLDFSIAGTYSNFVEMIPYEGDTLTGGFEAAKQWAEQMIGDGVLYAYTHAIDANGQRNGYLFADTNNDGHMDTGIELANAGALLWSDII